MSQSNTSVVSIRNTKEKRVQKHKKRKKKRNLYTHNTRRGHKFIPYHLNCLIPKSKLGKGQENLTVQLPEPIYNSLHFLFDSFGGDEQKIIQFLIQIQKLMRTQSNQYPAVIKESDIADLVQQITGKNWLLKSVKGNHRYTIHHITPKSRLRKGQKEQTVQLPKLFHSAWHLLFDNLYGQEIIEFIIEFQQKMRCQLLITEVEIMLLQQNIKSRNLNKNT